MLPVLLCVAFSAIVPLMTVVNYSVQDIISPERRVFVGTEWFAVGDARRRTARARCGASSASRSRCWWSRSRWASRSRCRCRPQGWKASAVLVLVALSLLIPWNVVGTIWQIYGRADIGLFGATLQKMGIDYSYTGNAHRCLAHGAADGRLALDAAGGAAVLRGPALDPRRLLPGRAHRRRQQVRGVPLHPAAQDARRADDRRAAALHGQLHDLHRALRAHGRRARQCHHLPDASTSRRRPSASSTWARRRLSR